MKTEILTADDKGLRRAAEIINSGEAVAFPTETVYGLGADALNPYAVEKIFAAKGRPSDNPLIVHIADKNSLSKIVKNIPEKAELLMEKFWPGPLTIIMEKSDKVPPSVTAGLSTVGVRMPNLNSAREFIRLSGCPIAAPSANISGKPSPTSFSDTFEDMNGRVAAIIKGEQSEVGVESTVIDMTSEIPVILRPGGVTTAQIEEVIGKVRISEALSDNNVPKAPGMKYKHYSPRAKVYIAKGTLDEIKSFLSEKRAFLGKAGVLCFDEMEEELKGEAITVSLGRISHPEDAANRLFAALRKMDSFGADIIFAPEIPERGLWMAVKNRLYKAAGENILDIKKTECMLFVCAGNTCRSPMAEGIFYSLGKNIVVASAGLAAPYGEGANEKAVTAAKKMGADISGHRAKNLNMEMLKAADIVAAMTESIKDAVFIPEKTKTLYELVGKQGDINDPYGGSQEVYDACAKEIKKIAEEYFEKYEN